MIEEQKLHSRGRRAEPGRMTSRNCSQQSPEQNFTLKADALNWVLCEGKS